MDLKLEDIQLYEFEKDTPGAEDFIPKAAEFLFTTLGDYGDPLEDITRSLHYALELMPSFGGFFIVAKLDEKILGCVSVNRTGMKGYIPENNVTYLAVDAECRGLGLGEKLLRRAVEKAEGNLSLHVEPRNPAIRMYEKIGFRHKYNEMRLWKETLPQFQDAKDH